jgi:hypothetical protein
VQQSANYNHYIHGCPDINNHDTIITITTLKATFYQTFLSHSCFDCTTLSLSLSLTQFRKLFFSIVALKEKPRDKSREFSLYREESSSNWLLSIHTSSGASFTMITKGKSQVFEKN